MLRSKKYTNEPIKVSVAMIAYNVGKYIETAIESVLEQECNFRVQIVIGEDCSTDNTRELVLKYQEEYPSIIKVLLPEKNQGLTPNSVATQNACDGEYIALLDGDDYWTNPEKLQHQIDFLDQNPEYSGSAHQAQIVFDDIDGEDRKFGSDTDTTLYLKDTISHRKFHTSSLIYRRAIWVETGGIPSTILSNERAIYPMVAIFGKINYLGKPMCIYRRSSIGISARITMTELEKDLKMIPWLKSISKDFPASKFRSFLHFSTYTYALKKPLFQTLKHYFFFAFYSFSYFPKNLGDVKHGTGLLINFLFKRGN